MRKIVFLSLIVAFLVSCETAEEKKKRLEREEKARIELEQKRKKEEAERAYKLEQERKEKEIYEKYINNSLSTGATPYASCYGYNTSCKKWGCSQIKVTTPYNSDVIVLIKQDGKVVRHAYITKSSNYTFEMPNGVYQTFFYYGKGWNPNKKIENKSCGTIKGGFVANETVGKDVAQNLNNSILTYELILQQNGNFRTQRSNKNEIVGIGRW